MKHPGSGIGQRARRAGLGWVPEELLAEQFGVQRRPQNLRLIRARSALLCFCDGLCRAELVHHDETVSARYDPLDVRVDVARRDHESVTLPVYRVVLTNRERQQLLARRLPTFADDVNRVVRLLAYRFGDAFDLAIGRPKGCFILGDPCFTVIHDTTLLPRC